MCPKLANLLEIFLSKFTESINTEQANFLDYFSAELGSSHPHPLLLSMRTSGSEEFTPVPFSCCILPPAQTAFAVLVGMCSIVLGPVEEGFFSCPKELLLWCSVPVSPGQQSGQGPGQSCRDEAEDPGQLQHICSMGWDDRDVCPQWDQQSFQDFKKTPSQQALAWELAGQWHQPLNRIFLLKYIPPPALWSILSRGYGLGINSLSVR